MLDNLLDIEVAYSLLRGGAQDNENDPIDINYEKLKTKIEVRLPPTHTHKLLLSGEIMYRWITAFCLFVFFTGCWQDLRRG